MAKTIKFVEGFDEYPPLFANFPSDPEIRITGGSGDPASYVTFSNAASRWGFGLGFNQIGASGATSLASADCLAYALGSTRADGNGIICSFAYRPADGVSSKGICCVVNADGDQIIGLGTSALGYPRLYGANHAVGSNSPPLIAEAAAPLGGANWVFVDFLFIAGANGTGSVVKVWIDGALTFNWSGTIPATGTVPWAWSDFILGGCWMTQVIVQWGGQQFDDMHMLVTTAPTTDTPIGDSRVDTIFPTTEATNTGYTLGAGTNVQAALATVDNDTSYYVGTHLNDQVVFDSTDALHGVPQTIHCVEVGHVSRKTLAASRTVAPVLKDGATVAVGANGTLSTSYARKRALWPLRPSDGTAWTKTTVEAAAFGVKITG